MSERNWKSASLGLVDDDPAICALPIDGDVRMADLAVFERKVTIGDATKDSDDYLSSWILGDFTGGGQIDTINEGTDTTRFWWSTADTRWVNQISCPPETATTRPSGATGTCYPLGDVTRTTTGKISTFYACFGATPYGYDADSRDWYAAGTDLAAAPLGPGVRYRGTGSDTLLYVPLGASGYATLKETTPGTPIVSNVAAASDVPAALFFATVDTRLFAFDTGGVLWSNPGDGTWTKILKPEADDTNTNNPLVFDLSREPRALVTYADKSGTPTLTLVTDEDAWMYVEAAHAWNRTNIQSLHPDFGRAAAMFRPGEDLWVAAGTDIVRLSSAGVIIPFSGLNRDDGLPKEYRGAIVSLCAEPSNLYALIQGDTADATDQSFVEAGGLSFDDLPYFPTSAAYATLQAWNGTGWHGLWASDAPAATPTWLVISRVAGDPKLWWGMGDGNAYFQPLRTDFQGPKQARQLGTNTFAPSAVLELGWFDAAMLAFDKIASHFSVDMDHADDNDYVTVQYKTETDDDWVTLGSASAPDLTSLPFGLTLDGDGASFSTGQNFKRFKPRFLFTRDPAVNTTTPVMRAAVLVFKKRPQNTKSFQFTVPLPPDQWNGRTGSEIAAHLDRLITAKQFARFVHQGQTYRVAVAGVAGQDDTGYSELGARTVSLIAIPTEV